MSHISTSLSCVIPTHQRTAFLRECLDSVRNQSVPPLEVIVVSDVVDPKSRQLCKEVSETWSDSRLVYLERDGQPGASASRNAGASASVGTHIAYLDDDDLWQPDFVRAVQARIARGDADIIVVAREIFGEGFSATAPTVPEGRGWRDFAARSLGTTGSNMVVSRDAVDAIGGFDASLPVKNDSDFFLRLLLAGFEYCVVDEVLVRQRKHDSGQLTVKDERRASGTEAYIAKHQAVLSRSDIRKLRVTIHRIRAGVAPSRAARLFHRAAAVWNYSIPEFLRERREREIWRHLA